MSKLETNTIDTVSGTSTLQVGSTNTSTITLGVSGDTINVPSGVTIANSGTATGFGATFSPRFQAHLGSTQSVSAGTETVVALSDEDFDVGGCFNNTSGTVTLNGISTPAYSFAPNVAGLYVIGAKLFAQSGSQYSIMYVYKNTTMIVENQFNNDIGSARAHYVTTVVSMNGSSDYLNMRWYVDQTKNIYNNLHNTNLFGYLLKAD